MSYPVPPNEAERLRALQSYRILDTPFEQEYDDIVALASEICETPMAFITLIDEARQWFKARVGSEDLESPRELAFCAHAICRPEEIMVVPDARLDGRLSNYANVKSVPGIRFYAGAPLVTAGGFALGTLCVADHEPRELTPAQDRALRVLRRHVVNALELRRLVHEQHANIVQLREAQQALEASRARAVAATDAKSRFLATMSHEIRTPMNAVVGMTELIARTPLNPAQSDAVDTIRSSGQLLLRLVNDILDLAKIESGRLELEEAPFSVHAAVDHAVRLVRPAADAKGLTMTVEFSPEIPAQVVGDVTRLTQILVNLLSNAVKFTAAGRVELHAGARARATGDLELTFAVRDTGIGLSAEQIARLFQEFSQAEISTAREYGGTGLGLAISQRLARLHRGTICVDSVPGQGATFTLTILARTADAATDRPATEATASPLLDANFAQRHPARLLVADDNAVNRQLVLRQLQRLGYTADLASDGLQTLAAWRTGGHSVVLLDVEMPELDGLGVAAAIRRETTGTPPKILMLTGHASPAARAACLAAGAEDCLVKPVTLADLARALERTLAPAAR